MNLIDLSKVLTESTLEITKKDVFPSSVDVYISADDGDIFRAVDFVQLLYSDKLKSFVLVFCGNE